MSNLKYMSHHSVWSETQLFRGLLTPSNYLILEAFPQMLCVIWKSDIHIGQRRYDCSNSRWCKCTQQI